MVAQELEELLLEINQEIFYLNACMKLGFQILQISKNINDNLKLKSTYITNILKCVPPEDKPLSNEILNCSNFFDEEIL